MTRTVLFDESLTAQRSFYEGHRATHVCVSLGMFGDVSGQRYCSIWEKRHPVGRWGAYFGLLQGSSEQLSARRKLYRQGLMPLEIAAVGEAGPRVAVSEVWGELEEPGYSIAAVGIPDKDMSRRASQYFEQGWLVRSLARYRTSNHVLYAAVLVFRTAPGFRPWSVLSVAPPKPKKVLPGVPAVLTDSYRETHYHTWANAMARGFVRPQWALATNDEFVSVWHDEPVGSWQMSLHETKTELQHRIAEMAREGLEPSRIQAEHISITRRPPGTRIHRPPVTEEVPLFTTIFFKDGAKHKNRQWSKTGTAGFHPNAGGGVEGQLEAFAKSLMVESGIRGLQIAISRNAKLMYSRVFNWIEEEDYRTHELSCLRMASVSKAVTATAALRIWQDKRNQGWRLDADPSGSTKVQDILNIKTIRGGTIPRQGNNFFDVTLQHLLTHTSGWRKRAVAVVQEDVLAALRSIDPGTNYPLTRAQCASFYVENPDNIPFKPGTSGAYSGTGMMLLGMAIEAFRNEPYEVAVRNLILRPLNISRMKRTVARFGETPGEPRVFHGMPSVSGNVGTPQPLDLGIHDSVEFDIDDWAPDPAIYSGNTILSQANGAWVAPAVEIVRLLAAFDLGDDNPNGISAATRDKLLYELGAPQLDPPGNVAYGWFTANSLPSVVKLGTPLPGQTQRYLSQAGAFHNGATTGGVSVASRGQLDQISIAIFSNTSPLYSLGTQNGSEPFSAYEYPGLGVSQVDAIRQILRGLTEAEWNTQGARNLWGDVDHDWVHW